MDEPETASELEQLRRQRDLYAALSETNQLVTVHEPDPATLFRELCRIVVIHGRLALAWIGEPDDQGWVRPAAAHGEASNYIHHVRISTDAALPEGRGPTGTALRENRHVIAPDIHADPSMSPWHQAAARVGLRSSAAFPVLRNGTPVATLNVYARDPYFFTDELVNLLRELTFDVSFALDNFDRKAEHQRLIEMIAGTPDFIGIADPQGNVLYHNPAAIKFLGADRASRSVEAHHPISSGRRILNEAFPAAREHGTWRGETEFLNHDGEAVPFDQTILAHRNRDGGITHYSTIARNISERRKAEEAVRRLAYEDQITGLPNRVALLEQLPTALARAAGQGRHGALLTLDLDDFKAINETLGHPSGDALLKALALRLIDTVPTGGTMARLGGDEFAILLQDLSSDAGEAESQAEAVGRTILNRLAKPIAFEDHWIYVSTCIGISLFCAASGSPERVMQESDGALHEAKQDGRGSVGFHRNATLQEVHKRLTIEQKLRKALEEERIRPVFQPLYCLQTRKLRGFEALARLYEVDGSMVSPGEFIPVADRTGLILPLGEQILYQALTWMRQSLDRHPDWDDVRVSVNVSPRQFQQPDFVERIEKALETSGVSGDRLRLEITEGLLVQRTESTLEKLGGVRALGISLAIDDFGTGYSSLAYLQQLPVEVLKIDASFVQKLFQRQRAEVLVETILAMANHLDLATVAEGIETAEQETYLAGRGCQTGQGYLYARPMPPEQLTTFLGE